MGFSRRKAPVFCRHHDRALLHGGNQDPPFSGDGNNPELGVSSQRPVFLADDNEAEARSLGQVPH